MGLIPIVIYNVPLNSTVIFCKFKAENVRIAVAIVRLSNAVIVKNNKNLWGIMVGIWYYFNKDFIKQDLDQILK